MTHTDPLHEEYDAIFPKAEGLQNFVREQLETLLRDNDVILGIPIEFRIKEWDSIAEKIRRKSLVLPNIAALPDLVALRLVLLFHRDVETICRLIEENFDIIKSEDVSKRLDETMFGYQSRHLNVMIPSAWRTLPVLRGAGDLQVEIQVRTVAQHIWAAASHKLQYKHEQSVPSPVRRAIHRVAALLEVVDLEFERVLKERESYSASDPQHLTDERLSVDTLSAILTEVLPPQNKSDDEEYDDFLVDLAHFGVDTVGKVRAILSRHQLEVARSEEAFVRSEFMGTTRERMKKGVYFTHIGLARQAMQLEFGDAFDDYMAAQYSPGAPIED
jgi:ppGpp synthetase/RelA/SpoT-type nucleotidyltranferase